MTAGRFGPDTGRGTGDRDVEVRLYPAGWQPQALAPPPPAPDRALTPAALARGVAPVQQATGLAVYEALCADAGWRPA